MGIRMDRSCRQLIVLSSLVFAVIASPAWAQTAPEPAPETEPRFSVSGTFGLFSDYRFRGVSLTGNDLAAQGSVSVTAPFGLSGGIWASNLDTASGDSLELDVFAAKSFDVKGTSLSIGGIGYLFPGNNGLNYGEATISAARSTSPSAAITPGRKPARAAATIFTGSPMRRRPWVKLGRWRCRPGPDLPMKAAPLRSASTKSIGISG